MSETVSTGEPKLTTGRRGFLRSSTVLTASAAAGRMEPMLRDADRDNYMVGHVLAIEVQVR